MVGLVLAERNSVVLTVGTVELLSVFGVGALFKQQQRITGEQTRQGKEFFSYFPLNFVMRRHNLKGQRQLQLPDSIFMILINFYQKHESDNFYSASPLNLKGNCCKKFVSDLYPLEIPAPTKKFNFFQTDNLT
jgi:hypothetical protein